MRQITLVLPLPIETFWIVFVDLDSRRAWHKHVLSLRAVDHERKLLEDCEVRGQFIKGLSLRPIKNVWFFWCDEPVSLPSGFGEKMGSDGWCDGYPKDLSVTTNERTEQIGWRDTAIQPQ